MDIPAEHFLLKDASYVKDERKFFKGVVVLTNPDAGEVTSNPPSNPSQGGPPPTDPAALELGFLFVSEKSVPLCHTCKKPGHQRADCPEKKVRRCRFCQQEGHNVKECPVKPCTNCSEIGHAREDCTAPVVQKRRKPNRKECANCDSHEHRTDGCSEPCGNCKEPGHTVMDCFAGRSEALGSTAPGASNRTADAAQVASPTGAVPGPVHVEPAPSTTIDEQEAANNAEGDDDVATIEPCNALVLPNSDRLTVSFVTQLLDPHITSCSVKFDASYASDGAAGGREHKTALVRFTCANIDQNEVSVKAVDVASPEVARLLSPAVRATGRSLLRTFSDAGQSEMALYQLSLVFHASKSGEQAEGRLGEYFFADGDFGPFTATIRQLRDRLLSSDKARIDFFCLSADWIVGHIDVVNASLREQHASNPLLNWFPNGKANIQKGMEKKPDERPTYQIPPRLQFDSPLEYFTVQFYATLANAEAEATNPRVKTVIRLVSFPAGSDRIYFAAIEMADGLQLRPDSTASVNFFGEDADSETDWKVHIVAPVPFASGYDYSGFLFRRRSGGEFAEGPNIAAESILDSCDYPTVDRLSEALVEMRGIACHVQEQKPTVGMRRELNTLRHLFQNRNSFALELKVLCGNDFVNLPVIDYFRCDREMYGDDAVDAALEYVSARMTEEQQSILALLSHMTAGLAFVQGPGGTGKSSMAVQLILYQFHLGALRQDPARIWVLSPLNRQLDDLAYKINTVLMDEYRTMQEDGKDPKYPIVIRRHMRETEKKIWKDKSQIQRTEAGVDVVPEHIDSEEAAEDESVLADYALHELAMSVHIYNTFRASKVTGFDKRLTNVDLAEGTWVLRRAGFPEGPGETTHPIAKPDQYKEFRELLTRFAAGEALQRADITALTLMSNCIIHDLAELADAILMTPDVVSQKRAHGASRARAVLHDEAGKATEVASAAGIVFSRPYSYGILESVVYQGEPVPQVFFGDMYQPQPTLGPTNSLNFAEQRSTSLFTRLIKCGAPTLWLQRQHRFVNDIADLLNNVLPHGQVTTSKAVEDREKAKLVARFFKEVLRLERSVAFLSTNGSAEVNPVSRSTYNIHNVQRMLWLVLELLAFGFQGEDIGIGVPYTAQLALYLAGRFAMESWCYEQREGVYYNIRDEVMKVQVFTIDGIQGAEMEVMLFDTTVSDNLKFMRDTARMLLGLSRPRSGLVLLGNAHGVQSFYLSQQRLLSNTAYNKIVKWCKDKKVFVNLERKDMVELYKNLWAPFNVTERLARVYRERSRTDDPVSYSQDVQHNIAMPGFAADPPGFAEDPPAVDASTPPPPEPLDPGVKAELIAQAKRTVRGWFGHSEESGDMVITKDEARTQLNRLVREASKRSEESTRENFAAAACLVHILNKLNLDELDLNGGYVFDQRYGMLEDDPYRDRPGYASHVAFYGHIEKIETHQNAFGDLLDEDFSSSDDKPEVRSMIADLVGQLNLPSALVRLFLLANNLDEDLARRNMLLLRLRIWNADATITAHEEETISAMALIGRLEKCNWNAHEAHDYYTPSAGSGETTEIGESTEVGETAEVTWDSGNQGGGDKDAGDWDSGDQNGGAWAPV